MTDDYMGRRRANGIGFEMRQLRRRIAAVEAALGISPPTVTDRENRQNTAEDRKEMTDDRDTER